MLEGGSGRRSEKTLVPSAVPACPVTRVKTVRCVACFAYGRNEDAPHVPLGPARTGGHVISRTRAQ
jgi:hypothetical protein